MSKKDEASLVINKIILYARNGNDTKFLKYLVHAKNFHCSSRGGFEQTMMKKGALQAIQLSIKKSVDKNLGLSRNEADTKKVEGEVQEETETISNEEKRKHALQMSIYLIALRILANAFSLDYHAKLEAFRGGFISTLMKLTTRLNPNIHDSLTADIISKAVKCIGNLTSDASYRAAISECGFPQFLIGLVKTIYTEAENERFKTIVDIDSANINGTTSDSKGMESPVPPVPLSQDMLNLLASCLRTIRILCLYEDSQQMFVAENSIIHVGNLLCWTVQDKNVGLSDNTIADIVRILWCLTEKPKHVNETTIEQLMLKTNGASILSCIMDMFRESVLDSKLMEFLNRLLLNVCCHHKLAFELSASLKIFHVILEKLSKSTETSFQERLIKLLTLLTKNSNENINTFYLSKCTNIGVTLSLFRNAKLKHCQLSILQIYEALFLYEHCLKCLVSAGLFEQLHDLLQEHVGICTYETLSKRIFQLSLLTDTTECLFHEASKCPFMPAAAPVISKSPSSAIATTADIPKSPLQNQEMQEYVRVRKSGTEKIESPVHYQNNSSATSPSSISPTYSWCSGDSNGVELDVYMYTNNNSNQNSLSPISSAEDEECAVTTKHKYMFSPVRDEFDDDEEECYSLSSDNHDAPADLKDDSESSPPSKRHRLNEPSEDATVHEESSSCSASTSVMPKRVHSVKYSCKVLVSTLGIVQKCTQLKHPVLGVLTLVPFLLTYVLNSRLHKPAVPPEGWDTECASLGTRAFKIALKILRSSYCNISLFPELFLKPMVSLLYQMRQLPDPIPDSPSAEGNISLYCDKLLQCFSGSENDTIGWREGHILRLLLLNQDDSERLTASINIPLLYKVDSSRFQDFDRKGHSWENMFNALENWDKLPLPRFKDCIMSLCSLCETLGMRWREINRNYRLLGRKSTFSQDSTTTNAVVNDDEVIVEFDDGSKIFCETDVMTSASPVFTAMFDGHFIETGQRKVLMKDTTQSAFMALLDQIRFCSSVKDGQLPSDENNIVNSQNDLYDIKTLFELLSLADRFLLDEVYERTLNSIISSNYLCPYSAPTIYLYSVKSEWNTNNAQSTVEDLPNFITLRFLLVANNISLSVRLEAFRKIFHTVLASVVVNDLRDLVQHYARKLK